MWILGTGGSPALQFYARTVNFISKFYAGWDYSKAMTATRSNPMPYHPPRKADSMPIVWSRDESLWLDCSSAAEDPAVTEAIARNNSPAAVFGETGRVLLAILAAIVIIYGSLGFFQIY